MTNDILNRIEKHHGFKFRCYAFVILTPILVFTGSIEFYVISCCN